ncbi:unnamed protein product [Linum tenue]|uniref:DDT domain-containing protein DDR4 n=1 Tax=Linum tenue TaxID=586396 RepID=A0AAV0Q4N8_9ROSI|nr:unnamed protein product [Linum tenue]
MSRDQPSSSPPNPISPSQTPKPADGDTNGAVAVKPQPSDPATPTTYRSNRPSRACTLRAAAKLQQQQQQQQAKPKPKKDHRQQQQQRRRRQEEEEGEDQEEDDDDGGSGDELSLHNKDQCSSGASKVVTSLVAPPEPAQLPRWNLRSMWELASVLNFLHVFRPLLNIQVEFSAEEFETALLSPNDTLGEIHMPLLKAIPPITRMALTRDTWVTVLCRKLRDWWHWVADGDLPLVASQGAEVEAYKTLEPAVRVVILKALCDIRVEQEDIRNYIESSIKHGAQLLLFRKERIGGDSQGINYWYEPDELVGHRLYREIRTAEVLTKGKTKGSKVLPSTIYQWETVATNFDEFVDVSEKLFTSTNRTEVSLGKKLKNDMLPDIEKVQKRKERLLKKQHRQALLLDNYMHVDGLAAGRSLRDRKPVTYTFDDYDRSINEAIKVTKKKPSSPEHDQRREGVFRPEASANGRLGGPSYSAAAHHGGSFSAMSPLSSDYDFIDSDHNNNKLNNLDRGNRRRQRPQRYSAKDYVEAISDNEHEFDSDDDIVGEAVYDEEYLRKRKMRKLSSSSEGDEEYKWDGENGEEEEEEEEEDSLSISEEGSDDPHNKFKKLAAGRTRRESKLRSVEDLQSGLRRSKRSTRNRINYKQYEPSDSEPEAAKQRDNHSGASENGEFSTGTQDYDDGNDGNEEVENGDDDDEQDMKVVDQQPVEGYMEGYSEMTVKEESKPPEKSSSPPLAGGQDDEIDGVKKTQFLDLNEMAPGSGFDDGPNILMKDEVNGDNF